MRRGNSSPCRFVFSISALIVLATLPLSASVICLGERVSLKKKKASFHHTNLDTATAAELQQAPGIGPSSAARVLKMRKPLRPFKGARSPRHQRHRPKRMEKMRKYLTLGKVPAKRPPPKTFTLIYGLRLAGG